MSRLCTAASSKLYRSSGMRLVLVIPLLSCMIIMSNVCYMAFSSTPSGVHSHSVTNREMTAAHPYRSSHEEARRLPKCIILGFRKAGTRALLSYLNVHPDIQTAKDEIGFFSDDEKYEKGLEYYREQMPLSYEHQITIEKSPFYVESTVAPERIYRMNSSILLIIIVRDPIIRLVSDYVHSRENRIRDGRKTEPFEATICNSKGDINTLSSNVRRSMYSMHFPRWTKLFSTKQIHIVDGDNLIVNPYKEVFEVETFLGIEHNITKHNFYFNKDKGFYCFMSMENNSLCLGKSKGRENPNVDPLVLSELKSYYSDKNEDFFKLVNRTFNW